MTSPSVKHVSVTIDRPAARVYEFASNPEYLPRWASGLSGSISKDLKKLKTVLEK